MTCSSLGGASACVSTHHSQAVPCRSDALSPVAFLAPPYVATRSWSLICFFQLTSPVGQVGEAHGETRRARMVHNPHAVWVVTPASERRLAGTRETRDHGHERLGILNKCELEKAEDLA